MTCSIHFQHLSIHESLLAPMESAGLKVLHALEQTDCELTIVLAEIEEIRSLNREFAGSEGPTDVLSFPDGSIDPSSKKLYLGDVIICTPIAKENAESSGHSLEEELVLLTIHGILHLLGFDHDQANRKKEMWELQEQVLKELGIDLQIP